MGLERDLYVLMAEVATRRATARKLVAGTTLVTAEMVAALEARIDDLTGRFDDARPSSSCPGRTALSAALDVARTVVRRAERLASGRPGRGVRWSVPYLNRLSDLLWTMARWQEGDAPAPRARRRKT